ncbi:MAG: hypothetical protein IPJ65_08510 [Archangiaceae bacterium]|nr:hypothetical protein [Archangiaceae bacterium]
MLTLALLNLVLAKPWNGITPGVSTRDDVLKRFGEPSKVVTAAGREVLAYQKGKLIKGTTQTQFRVEPKSGVVERIDVFPEPVLTLPQIASAYGPACTLEVPEAPDRPCYLKHDDPTRAYVTYVRLGLAVFFNPDGKTVQTFAFLPEKK